MKIKRFCQVGLLVRDADAMFERFVTHFGVDRDSLDVSDTKDPNLRYKDATVHGKPQRYDARFLFFQLGGIEIELIQPLDENSIYAEFLKQHGEGLHHLQAEVEDHEEFFSTMNELNAPDICGGHIENTAYRYFDATSSLGMIMEVCWKKAFDA